MAGYGMAALSKPLFPLAASAPAVMAARFADRIGKGIRGAPRDAMLADETPPEIRGRAFGLRQALDTVGALLAPLAAIGLMAWFASDIRAVFWIAVIPAARSFLLAWLALREPEAASRAAQAIALLRRLPRARHGHQAAAPGRLPVHARPLLRGFLILKGIDIGLSEAMSPLTLAIFNLAYVALAYPAGALSDRMSPRSILMAGIAVLIAGNLVLAQTGSFAGLVDRHRSVGRAHGADPGHFRANDRRQRARTAARDQLRRLLVRHRHCRRCSPASAPAGCGTAKAQRRPSSPARSSRRVALAMLSLLESTGLALADDRLLAVGRLERRHPARGAIMIEELMLERRGDVQQQQRDRREHQDHVKVARSFAGVSTDAGDDRDA